MKDEQKKNLEHVCVFFWTEKLTAGITEEETEVKQRAQRTVPVLLLVETL